MTEAPASTPATDSQPEEWKPEPRTWAWKDLFTAPMLAFKPKCMLISALTVAVVGLFCWLWHGQLGGLTIGDTTVAQQAVLGPIFTVLGAMGALALFGIGASLVAVFMKADLLDDEFLSLGEALGQFRERVKASVLVPVFLMAVLAGFGLLIYVPMLVGSIPLAGPILYGLLYPLGFLLGLLVVLLSIAVVLSVFLFPAIVAIRKHGWFDNVIDTFEAVGTKPHLVALNGLLTLLMAGIGVGIATGGMRVLADTANHPALPGTAVAAADNRATQVVQRVVGNPGMPASPLAGDTLPGSAASLALATSVGTPAAVEGHDTTFNVWGPGLLVSFWKILLLVFIGGYAVNVVIAGGMLTYLTVREDDYWDDEDLEDLDQLAKELEEEAKAEEAKLAAAQAAAAPAATGSSDEAKPQA